MRTFDIFGWHLFLGRKAANGKSKAIVINGCKVDKPKIAVACPECGQTLFPYFPEPGILSGKAEYRLVSNWAETGNLILKLSCPNCNCTGEGWFTLVEVRP